MQRTGRWKSSGRSSLLGTAFLTLIALATRSFSIYKPISLAFFESTTGALMIIAGGFLLLGGVFEELKAITHSTRFEESCELAGYGFILMASFGTGLTSMFACRRQA